MTVPISRLRRWLAHSSDKPDQSDLLGMPDSAQATDESKKGKDRKKPRLDESRAGVLWRGARKSVLIRSLSDLRPADTLVLPVAAAGWDELGHVPSHTAIEIPSQISIDIAEQAFRTARDRAVLRLHSTLRSGFPDLPAITELFDRVSDPIESPTQAELRRLLTQVAETLGPDHDDLANSCRNLASRRFGMLRESYPDELGIVLTTRGRVRSATSWYLPIVDEGEDDRSRTLRDHPVSLTDHTHHVRDEVIRAVERLPVAELKDAYRLAADLHDLGKADERFQGMLRRADRTEAWLLVGRDSALLAKSASMPQTPQQRKEARDRAGLPEGFRHEMLSVQIAGEGDLISSAAELRALILHLIASHHGFARPFAPVVIEIDTPDVTVKGVTVTGTTRLDRPPHRVDSGIAERFWKLTRDFGWWGLAYLEAVLRLADQQASADEDAGVFDAGVSAAEFVRTPT
jgi:CRISPR-associated endonuclease/helicase Cas3